MPKFDMGRAFDDAMTMLSKNRELVLVVAGVFFFLPQLAMAIIFADEMLALEAASANAAASPEKMMEFMSEFYASTWWAYLLSTIISAIGTLGLMALLTDKARPTLRDALKTGMRFVLTYLAVMIITALILFVIVGLPMALAMASGVAAIIFIAIFAAFFLFIYIMVRFSLTVPVMGVEQIANPLTVIQRSWKLTNGNALSLFGFFVLLFIAMTVIAIVVTIAFGLVFGLMGEQGAVIGNGIVNGLTQAAFTTFFAGILVAIHAQLAGSNQSEIEETFQ